MTTQLLLACLSSQFCLVVGQLLVKHAMNGTNRTPIPWRQVISRFACGIVALTGWFFIWGGLLQQKDLSYIYPFEGLSPLLIVLSASILLKEKLTGQSLLGIGLISLGILLVASS